MIQQAIHRIQQMERYLDALREAVDADPHRLREDAALQEMLEALTRYYEDGQWLQDYELDEKGLLPQDLKRGVLAEDTLYDFFEEIRSSDNWE